VKRFAACRGLPDAAAGAGAGPAQEVGTAEAEAAAGAGGPEAVPVAGEDAAATGEEGEAGRVQRRGCGQTFPLPPFGQVAGTGKACPKCGWPLIRMVGGRGSREQCIDYYGCPSNEAARARRAARGSGGGRQAGGAGRGRRRARK